MVDAHLPTPAEKSAALGAHLEAVAERAIGYFCDPPVTRGREV